MLICCRHSKLTLIHIAYQVTKEDNKDITVIKIFRWLTTPQTYFTWVAQAKS